MRVGDSPRLDGTEVKRTRGHVAASPKARSPPRLGDGQCRAGTGTSEWMTAGTADTNDGARDPVVVTDRARSGVGGVEPPVGQPNGPSRRAGAKTVCLAPDHLSSAEWLKLAVDFRAPYGIPCLSVPSWLQAVKLGFPPLDCMELNRAKRWSSDVMAEAPWPENQPIVCGLCTMQICRHGWISLAGRTARLEVQGQGKRPAGRSSEVASALPSWRLARQRPGGHPRRPRGSVPPEARGILHRAWGVRAGGWTRRRGPPPFWHLPHAPEYGRAWRP